MTGGVSEDDKTLKNMKVVSMDEVTVINTHDYQLTSYDNNNDVFDCEQ